MRVLDVDGGSMAGRYSLHRGRLTVSDVRVVITSPLSPENVAAIAAADPRLDVVYEQDLIPAPEYPSAHPLPEIADAQAEERWVELLESAEILFDFGPLALADRLPEWPRLRWIQATSAGVGQLARRVGLTERRDIVVTTASGVHARPLAEFAVLAMLMFGKDVLRYQADQRAHALAPPRRRGGGGQGGGGGRGGPDRPRGVSAPARARRPRDRGRPHRSPAAPRPTSTPTRSPRSTTSTPSCPGWTRSSWRRPTRPRPTASSTPAGSGSCPSGRSS